jgi:Asp-tRNA(Asn)/Glu-tRNA(Gln) amidotransferase A subunit family amidase
MTMPGDLLSGTLIEIARDLREKRVTARELIEAAIAAHERFGERLHAYSLWAPEQAHRASGRTRPREGSHRRRRPVPVARLRSGDRRDRR